MDDRPIAHRCRRETTVRGWMLRITLVALLLAPVTWLSRAVGRAREDARRSQCSGNLCALAIALLNYHDVHGMFPPAVVHGPDGEPWHSWRVLILPYLSSDLATSYRFDEPWDGPNNRRLIDQMPAFFACPSAQDYRAPVKRFTNYVVVTGPGTCFPPDRAARLDEIADRARTILVAEAPGLAIPWTAPIDLDAADLAGRGRPHSAHPGGRNVRFADGTYQFLRGPLDPGRPGASGSDLRRPNATASD